MEVILAAQEVLAVHGNRLEVVLVLVLEVLHLLHIHANLHPGMMRFSINPMKRVKEAFSVADNGK